MGEIRTMRVKIPREEGLEYFSVFSAKIFEMFCSLMLLKVLLQTLGR